MGIQNAQILEGATISASGGTAKAYGPGGTKVVGGLQIIDTTVSDITARPFYNLSSTPATYSKSNGWSVDKRKIDCIRPFVNAAGEQQFPGIEIKCNYVAGMTDAQKLELEKMACQVFFDSDFQTFLRTGSVA